MSGPTVGRFEIGDFCWVQPVDLNERCSMFALHDAVILGGQWKVHCIAMLHCWNILPLTNAGALAVKAENEVSTPKLHERTKTPFWTTFTFFFAVLYSTSVRGTLVWRRRRVSVTVLTINLNVLMPKSNTYIGTYGAWWTLMSLACVQNIFNTPIAPATPWAHYTHHIFLSQHCHPLTDTFVMFLYSDPRTVGVFQEWPWEMYVLCK